MATLINCTVCTVRYGTAYDTARVRYEYRTATCGTPDFRMPQARNIADSSLRVNPYGSYNCGTYLLYKYEPYPTGTQSFTDNRTSPRFENGLVNGEKQSSRRRRGVVGKETTAPKIGLCDETQTAGQRRNGLFPPYFFVS